MPMSGNQLRSPNGRGSRTLRSGERFAQLRLPKDSSDSDDVDSEDSDYCDTSSFEPEDNGKQRLVVKKGSTAYVESDDPSITTDSDSETESFTEPNNHRPNEAELATRGPTQRRDYKRREESSKSLKLRNNRQLETGKSLSTSFLRSDINGNAANLVKSVNVNKEGNRVNDNKQNSNNNNNNNNNNS